MKVANEILARGSQGYFELGLPVIDPLKIDKMNIQQGQGPVSLKISLRNFDLKGLSDVRFSKIEGFQRDYDKARVELRFKYPSMRIEGPYKIDGRFLVLPVQGSGLANMTFCKFFYLDSN